MPGDTTRVVVGNNAALGTYIVSKGDFGTFIGVESVNVPWRNSYSHSMSGTCDPNLGTVMVDCELTGEYVFAQSARIEDTYDFTPAGTSPSPVPVPAGMPLLLAGLGLLGVLHRRR